jgi:Ni,Fe-hydrogenase III small subunit/NAD-dependent dihydropyrimidine dehydrogenase PreA subunit
MFKTIIGRLRQGHRTAEFPPKSANLSDRFRGFPVIGAGKCPDDCRKCVKVCPTGAVAGKRDLEIDLGKCLFCGDCESACPQGLIRFGREYRMAASTREGLVAGEREYQLARKLERESLALFGRSLRLREVSAGGCNGCEADVAVLNTVVFDLSRFGIQFVASPRHADGILVTGPVTGNMKQALEKTWDAVPAPKIVIAVGACAISGGPFAGHPQVHNGAGGILPVSLFIPGCPPHPLTILDGLLRLLGRIKDGR